MTRLRWICLCVAVVLMLSGCNPTESANPAGETEPTKLNSELICLEISRFTGGFVEDGTDRAVQDVAAILVRNDTGKFLDLATVTYKVGSRTATFRITGLPAGAQAWVLEADAMTLVPEDKLVFDKCQATYNANPMLATNDLAVSREGNALTVRNVSGRSLKNVCVYYKNHLEDGTFLGGITYMMSFGDIEPGASVTKGSGHLGSNSEIVRYSYQ